MEFFSESRPSRWSQRHTFLVGSSIHYKRPGPSDSGRLPPSSDYLWFTSTDSARGISWKSQRWLVSGVPPRNNYLPTRPRSHSGISPTDSQERLRIKSAKQRILLSVRLLF